MRGHSSYYWFHDLHGFLSNKKHKNNFTTDDMTSKFELFSNDKMGILHITEIMRSDWLHMLDEYWDEVNAPYSGGFISGQNGCFNITMNFI